MEWSTLVAITILALSTAACSNKAPHAKPVTGLVDATEIDVATKVPGRVFELHVREGDKVQSGQKLVTIESDELKAKMDQVNAAIDGSEARLKMAQSGARKEEKDAAREAVKAALHQVDIAKKMFDRVVTLLQQGAISQAQYDDAESKFSLARDQLALVEARNSLVLRGARGEEIDALKALVAQGKGSLAEVASYEKETIQLAPIAGEVSKVVLHRGELAATGYPILTIVDLDDVWATFSVREDMLQKIKKGARIHAEVPALGRKVEFEIYHVAAMGDFATWKATSDKDGFDLKSFEVKARPVNKGDGLRPGMTVRWIPE